MGKHRKRRKNYTKSWKNFRKQEKTFQKPQKPLENHENKARYMGKPLKSIEKPFGRLAKIEGDPRGDPEGAALQ